MKHIAIILTGLALLAGAQQGAAQPDEAQREALRKQLEDAREQLQQSARQVAELTRQLGEHGREAFVFEFMSDEKRGMIGVVLNREGDQLRIVSVTPGSPAHEAGVEAGDRLVAVNGEPVTFTKDSGHGPGATPEGLRGLKVGDEVTLTLEGERGTREVTVEAARGGHMAWAPAMEELRRLRVHVPDISRHVTLHEPPDVSAIAALVHPRGNRWGRVELAGLNPELGRYFGTDKGVLVVNAPEDNPLGLKGGDVIVSIGDREPTSPSQAFRIVHSYGKGETLEVEILRDGKRELLTHELTEEDFSGFGVAPPHPPRPPAPAAKPAPPATPVGPA